MANVLYEKRGHIARITFNRPEALNAFNQALWHELEAVWDDFNADPEIHVGVLTGAGERAFSAGADMKELAVRPPGGEERPRARLFDHGDIDVWKPLIAAVNGHALGAGLISALACDLRLASENATFGMPQVRWGIISGGGTQWLPRQIPRAIAMELLLTGRPIGAQRAYEVGLVNKVVPLPDLLPEAEALAEVICANGPVAVQGSKEAALRGLDLPFKEAIAFGLELERRAFAGPESGEGTRSFVEKRDPRFIRG
jgi:enoyl-CoA hydratase/carnithine racemase